MSTEPTPSAAPVDGIVIPDEVYCPACGITSKAEGTTNEFAAFVSCSRCHRMIRVIYADGDVSEVPV